MSNILFICHGNTCRSPMAEFIMKKLVQDAHRDKDFHIESAAVSNSVGYPVSQPAKRVLLKHDIDVPDRRSRQVCREDLDNFDYLVYMDADNLRLLLYLFPKAPKNKLHSIMEYADRPMDDVADPWDTGDYDSTWDDLYVGCSALLRKLQQAEQLIPLLEDPNDF